MVSPVALSEECVRGVLAARGVGKAGPTARAVIEALMAQGLVVTTEDMEARVARETRAHPEDGPCPDKISCPDDTVSSNTVLDDTTALDATLVPVSG